MSQQTQNFNRSSQTKSNQGLSHDEPATGKVGNNIEKDEPRAQGSSGVETAPTTRQSNK